MSPAALRLGPLPAHLPGDAELRHGFTLSQVTALSVFAVRRQLWHQAADFDHRLEIAWHAIVEHIYASERPPEVGEVIRAGWKAIGDEVNKTQQFHGRGTHDRYAGVTAGFERYWWFTARPTSGPEDKVIDRVALAQIWPKLRPVHREVLAALAACGDYGLAAASLGKSRQTFTTQVGKARREFLAWWHEGEVPSRPWGQDRRPVKDTDRHTITTRTIRRRQRQVRNGPPEGEATRPRKTGKARADLGITGAELVRRYEAGESVRQLAASVGRSYSVVHRRLRAEGAQFRPAGWPGENDDRVSPSA